MVGERRDAGNAGTCRNGLFDRRDGNTGLNKKAPTMPLTFKPLTFSLHIMLKLE